MISLCKPRLRSTMVKKYRTRAVLWSWSRRYLISRDSVRRDSTVGMVGTNSTSAAAKTFSVTFDKPGAQSRKT